MGGDILGADLLLRLGVDASGVAADLSSKLTGAERDVAASGGRMSTSVAGNSSKMQVATLRVVAAQERYNKVLQKEGATQGQRANAQASLIAAQNNLSKAQAGTNARVREGAAAAKGLAIAFIAAGAAAATYVLTSAGKFKEVATEVRNISRLTGESAENASKLRFAAQESGVGVDVLSASLRVLEAHLAKNDKAAQGLGISYQDAAGNLLPFDVILARISDQFARMPDGPEKTALALQTFGKQGTALLPLLNRGSAGFDQLAAKAEHLGLVLTGDNLAAVKKNTDAQKDLNSAVDSLQVSMGERALPVLTKFKEILAGGLNIAAEHEGLTTASTAALGLAAAFGKAGSFASNLNEISASVSSLIHLRTPKTILDNAAVARSYDALAISAGRAAEAEGAAAVAPAGGSVGGRVRGGRLGGAARLGGLAIGSSLAIAGSTGAIGRATGSSALNTAGDIAGYALGGAAIGSMIAPGLGTAIGGGVGALAGTAMSIFGPSGTEQTSTKRTPAQIKADLAGVAGELKKIHDIAQDPNGAGPVGASRVAQVEALRDKQSKLNDELKLSQDQAKQTFNTFDAGTGKMAQLTSAQIAAAAAAKTHTAALAKLRAEHRAVRESFAVDPFSGTPDDKKAVGPNSALRRLQNTLSGQRTLVKDLRKLERRGTSTETLDALRGLESSAPGTIHKIASKDSGSYAKEFNQTLRRLNHQTNVLAGIYEGSSTLAEKRARRDARAYNRAYAAEVNKTAIDFFTNGPAPVPGVSAPSAFPANKHGVNTRRRTP